MERPVSSMEFHQAVTRLVRVHYPFKISWDSLEASLPPALFQELRRRDQELTEFERRRKRRRTRKRRRSWLRAELRR